jgi:hypothetical protein
MSYGIKEDRYAEEATQTGRDRCEARSGGCPGKLLSRTTAEGAGADIIKPLIIREN